MNRWIIRIVCTASIVSATAFPMSAETRIDRRTVFDGNVVLEQIPEIPAALRDELRRYQNTRGASFESWSADGEGIYVTTRFGETNQLHHVSRPGGARRQLTFFDEPVVAAARRPRGDDLIFGMDEGGAEFYQIFLFDPATGLSRRLTDGSSRNRAARWSTDGKRLAFQSTRRNGRSNDIWVMEVGDPSSARIAFEAPDGASWTPVAWSSDDEQLLLQQRISVTDSRVHLLQLDSGETKLVAGGGENPGVYSARSFDADDRGLFLVTDADSEFRQLAHLDLESGELSSLTRGIPWDVGRFEISEDGKSAAFAVNEGGTDRLYLLDPRTREHRELGALPLGTIGNFEFSPDGTRLALTLNSSRSPSDVFSIEVDDRAAPPLQWTYSEVGGLDTGAFVEPELIHYPTFDEVDGERRRIPAFVYRPPGEGPHPVVIYIHGGPESQFRPRFNPRFQLWLARLGTAVIAPNVRGSAGYGKSWVKLDNGFLREDSVRDIGALLDWIATQPELDASRVAVRGGSYGGYMVLASLVHYSDRLAAGVEIVGISDFVTFLENTQDYRRDQRRVEYGDERDPEMRKFLDGIAPVRHADRITAPLFVAQGQNDPRVPASEAEQVVSAVRKAGYDVWFMQALNEGHGFRKKENADLFQQAEVLFLEKFLLGGAR